RANFSQVSAVRSSEDFGHRMRQTFRNFLADDVRRRVEDGLPALSRKGSDNQLVHDLVSLWLAFGQIEALMGRAERAMRGVLPYGEDAEPWHELANTIMAIGPE